MATNNKDGTNTDTDKKRRPFYLNWQLGIIFLVAILLVLAGSALAFGIRSVITYLSDPLNYAGFVAAVVAIVGVVAAVSKILAPVWEGIGKLWEAFGKLERKTDRAATLTTNNSADIAALTAGYRGMVDEMQQEREARQKEREEYRAEIAELKASRREDRIEKERMKEEIAELKRQLLNVNKESLSDKQEIAFLQAKVNSLETKVAKLESENSFLQQENRELKAVGGRRSTDKLGQLSPANEARLNHLEVEEKARKNKGENT